jgi:hypothetical protein
VSDNPSEHMSNGPDCYPDDCCNSCWVKWMAEAVKAERERIVELVDGCASWDQIIRLLKDLRAE